MARSITVPIAPVTITPVQVSTNEPSFFAFSFMPIHRTGCVTVTLDATGFVPVAACNAIWPDQAAAVAFSVIFGILVAHSVQAMIYRKTFCWVIIVAVAWLLGPFITRALAVQRRQLLTPYAVLALITLRVIFRLAKFSAGNSTDSPLPLHEAFCVLDAAPMAFACTLHLVLQRGEYLQGSFSTFSISSRRKARRSSASVERPRPKLTHGPGWFKCWHIDRDVRRTKMERIAAARWKIDANSKESAPNGVLGDDPMHC